MITQLSLFDAQPAAPVVSAPADDSACPMCGAPIVDTRWLAFGNDPTVCEACWEERQRTFVSRRRRKETTTS